jgi:hypothetical protein
MILANRFWRLLTVLMRLDIAASIAIAAALLFWVNWH